MKSVPVLPEGIYSASVTAFDAHGNVDADATARVMERNLREGAAGLFVGGSSGECFLLDPQERIRCFEAGARFGGRTTLIAHAGAISVKQAVDFARAALDMGYDAIAATAPFYYGFMPEDVCRYYYEISDAIGMPVLIYNFPGNTGKHFDPSNPHYQKLFRSGAILGVKHTNKDLYELERIRHVNPELQVFNGFDETMVAGFAFGVKSSIGSTFNFMLPHFLKIRSAYLAGDAGRALELQEKANNIMQALCSVGLIPSIKYILAEQGYPVGDPRSPFRPLTQEERQFVDGVLEDNLENDPD